MRKQAITQATTQATQDSIEELDITFGTLSFNVKLNRKGEYDHANLVQLPYQKESQPESPHPKLSDKKVYSKSQPPKEQKRNYGKKQMSKAGTVGTAGTEYRTVKIRPATGEWQQATKREKGNNSKQLRICFFCHKRGHIQRFCWQKIKCHKCGKSGHKYTNCLYKAPKNSTPTLPDHPASEKHKQPLNMELTQGRPHSGEIFNPPRHTLNEDNDYLCNVGLIVLIRGSPSPHLPRLMAAKIAETHGGHPTDFSITQATISPYIITCPNTQIRDAIVLNGLYSIPQSQVQFYVHEWRPRFGMGHDPATHEVWVKLVGLPLQAWTVAEITSILQRFGHPIEILPFGQAAGHFKDITALVATKSPSRIPLSYSYREGDYSARVEVLILRSRLRADTYFPPPDNHPPNIPPPYQGSQPHPHHGSNRETHAANSSSSSSGSFPTEPTIDLSAWSPRSNRLMLTTASFWVQKRQGNTNSVSKVGTRPPSTSPSFTLQTKPRGGKKLSVQIIAHTNSIAIRVTENQPHASITQPILSMIYLFTQPAPRPITINPFLQLTPTISHQRGNSRDVLATVTPHLRGCLSTDFSQEVSGTRGERTKEELSARASLLPTIYKCNNNTATFHSPPRPTTFSFGPASYFLINNSGPLSFQPVMPQQKITLLSTHSSNLFGPTLPTEAVLPDIHEPLLLNEPLHFLPAPQAHNGRLSSSCQIAELPSSPTPQEEAPVSQSLTPHSTALHQITLVQQTGKKRLMATRRSPRLQEKQRHNPVLQKASPKPRSKASKITFELHSHEDPLQLDAALSILQASGLQITQQVEDMIQEAITQNISANTGVEEEHRPSTPLHDHIPPRVMPGDSIVL